MLTMLTSLLRAKQDGDNNTMSSAYSKHPINRLSVYLA